MTRSALLMTGLLLLAMSPAVTAQFDPETDEGSRDIIPNLASSETAVGPSRFLFSLTDAEGHLIAAPDVTVGLSFYDGSANPDSVAFEADSRFLWAIEGVSGLYASNVTFPHGGLWATRFRVTFPDGASVETIRVPYDVRETSSTPAIGAPAPALKTPTANDVGGDLSLISTDPEPLERMYELSLDEAIAAEAPLVVAFVTPAFCTSATCGPTIETVKEVALAHPEINFVHLEPYIMAVQDGRLQPVLSEAGYLQAAPWTQAWGLLTEPFVAVVAADGTVQAKFEGAIAAAELAEALAGS